MNLLALHKTIESVAPILGVALENEGVRLDFTNEATDDQKIAAQLIADNWVDPPDPKFDGMLAELMFGSTYPNVQTWFNALPRTQSGFLEAQIASQDLTRIQWFLDNADTTAIANELTALFVAFDMPITITVPE